MSSNATKIFRITLLYFTLKKITRKNTKFKGLNREQTFKTTGTSNSCDSGKTKLRTDRSSSQNCINRSHYHLIFLTKKFRTNLLFWLFMNSSKSFWTRISPSIRNLLTIYHFVYVNLSKSIWSCIKLNWSSQLQIYQNLRCSGRFRYISLKRHFTSWTLHPNFKSA